jgi:hypothetical protein
MKLRGFAGMKGNRALKERLKWILTSGCSGSCNEEGFEDFPYVFRISMIDLLSRFILQCLYLS